MLNIKALVEKHPVLENIIKLEEIFWKNDKETNFDQAIKKIKLNAEDVKDAENRLQRFAPYIKKVFTETQKTNGIIESELTEISKMKNSLEELNNRPILGNLFLKCDSHLAISGSIKARGGIYEVLKHAEDLALEKGIITLNSNYEVLDSQNAKEFFSQYSIAVGSTGNLGLSIGIISAQLGFKVYVHMSSDAKKWKKDLLRSKGVEVIEYQSDYSKAVEEGRKQALNDDKMYFIDDENSKNLFLGYAVAASRLKDQLDKKNIVVNKENPLFVYLPCGVGGGPGGVAFGLKLIFKDNVYCFFAEPTHSPCMSIGMITNLHDAICVQDLGIDNKTEADGLAVGRASGFVGKTLENLISGCYTISDEKMYKYLSMLVDKEGIKLEPSALAGIKGILEIQNHYKNLKNSTHIAWATGGSMVPKEIMDEYYKKGKK